MVCLIITIILQNCGSCGRSLKPAGALNHSTINHTRWPHKKAIINMPSFLLMRHYAVKSSEWEQFRRLLSQGKIFSGKVL